MKTYNCLHLTKTIIKDMYLSQLLLLFLLFCSQHNCVRQTSQLCSYHLLPFLPFHPYLIWNNISYQNLDLMVTRHLKLSVVKFKTGMLNSNIGNWKKNLLYWPCRVACRTLLPRPGVNLCSLRGTWGVLTTRPPGKS